MSYEIETHMGTAVFGGARSGDQKWLDVWESTHQGEPGKAAVNRAKSDLAIGVSKSRVLDDASEEAKYLFANKVMRNDLETLILAAADLGLFVRVMVGKLPSSDELE